ncbi:mannosyltransferase [Mortierella alpina]|uniref:Mannosyltransferase n=1 Tax=Mortierella alpina TaxID=64518 RepID=A0A9P6JA45_MORAP|nr:mannosyltransferase [Mortierella alpina]
MPSPAGTGLRKPNGMLASESTKTTTATITSTTDHDENGATLQEDTATTTATSVKQPLKQRASPHTNGNGASKGNGYSKHEGRINGILVDKRTTDDEHEDSADSSSDTSSDRDPNDELLRWRNAVMPYCPSYSVAFKTLFLVRALAATYSNISDCDEVFNYWEPMHYLQYGSGLQTWEYSPLYAIRSWAYILLHTLAAEIARLAMSANRVTFLPSTFAMYTTMLFFSQMLQCPHRQSGKRTFWAIFWVGLGALLGWPFSAAVGLPFALEELLIHSRSQSRKKTVRFRDWRRMRLLRLLTSSVAVLGCVLVPIILIDRYYYKKLVVVPLNIVLYNVFGGDVGPDIFGTEPWWFYILNGLLNFNVLFLAAIASLPVLVLTYFTIPDVLPNAPSGTGQLKDPLLLFTLKLSPLYLWLAIFTAQPHKEERFLFVVYPLLCFNAVMTLFMAQKIVQRVLDRFVTRSKTAAIHKYSAGLVWVILIASAAISLSRILALHEHYSAPIEVYRRAFDLVQVPTPIVVESSDPAALPGSTVHSLNGDDARTPGLDNSVRVCVGKEWYRFPSHYFLPEGAKLGLIKSHFDGLLPGEFKEMAQNGELPPLSSQPSANGKQHKPVRIDWRWSAERRPGTSHIPRLMNNQNKEVSEHYTPLDQCQYLIDLDYSGRPENQGPEDLIEPRYLQDKEHWEKMYCKKFLDTAVGAGRNRWVRAFWIPDKITVALMRGQNKVWGDYCLARRKV